VNDVAGWSALNANRKRGEDFFQIFPEIITRKNFPDRAMSSLVLMARYPESFTR